MGIVWGTLGIVRGTFGIVRKTLGIVWGTFNIVRGTLRIVQGTFNIVLGTLSIVRGTFDTVDRNPTHLEEVFGEKRVGWDLAHEVHLEIIFAALQSVLSHQINAGLGLIHRPHKGDHHLHVAQTHLLPHL
jgi:hypothetical protein